MYTLALLAPIACGGDSHSAPTDVSAPKVAVHMVSGDRQVGVEGDSLAPIVVQVTNLQGVPQKNVEVTFSVNDRGTITPLTALTDENGNATAQWSLGIFDDHEGTAYVVKEGAAVAFSAHEPAGRVLDLMEIGLLRPRTFEGSRETVHPDYVRTPDDWGAYALHLALTPYPNGANAMENPSLYVSRSGFRWFPQAGITNPVVIPDGGGYLSDPDLVYVPNLRELWMYYRKVDSKNRVLLVRSSNGSQWGDAVEVASAPNHTLVSPAIVRRDSKTWLLYSVNGGALGCADVSASVELRRSTDGIHWGKPVATTIAAPGVLMPWHMEVQWIPSQNQYWALYPAKMPFSCATQALFLATSADGVTWKSYPSPVIKTGDFPDLRDIVYRSTFEYDETTDEVRFWFSGANLNGAFYDWRTVVQRQNRASLFAKISAPSSLLLNANMNRTMPAMLTPP